MLKEIKMQKRIMQALTLLAATVMSLPAQAQTLADRSDYWHYGWDWGWGHMLFGSVMMVLFWGGIILVIVLAVRWLGGESSQKPMRVASDKTALQILKDRFARGGIDREEFEERKQLLAD